MAATTTTTQSRSKKRGHGEGLVRLRADGRWEARVTLPSGKQKSLYGRTRRDVQHKLTAALRDVQQGILLPTGRQTVAQFLSRWLEDWAKSSVRPSTFDSYEALVRVHLIPSIGRIPLTNLTAEHVQQMLNEKQRAGVSARRRQMIHAVLRQRPQPCAQAAACRAQRGS